MTAEFYKGTDWESSSGPIISRMFDEADLWPVGARSGSGTKDVLADGLHPVLAIGGRAVADGRPNNVTGVVMTVSPSGGLVQMNVASMAAVKQYVANVLTYSGSPPTPATFEQAPVIGQPVYVDDSDDLAEGVTLSLSPLNEDGLANPLAGYLWYDQDEYPDSEVGGANLTNPWPKTWLNSLVYTKVTVLLTNATP